jgi:hypothetical protein
MELDIGTSIKVISPSAYVRYDAFFNYFPGKHYKHKWKEERQPTKGDILTVVDKHKHNVMDIMLYVVKDSRGRIFIIDIEGAGDFVEMDGPPISPDEFFEAIYSK